jgi:hypothetical protein
MIKNVGTDVMASFETSGGYYTVESRSGWNNFSYVSSRITTVIDNPETSEFDETVHTYCYKNSGRISGASTRSTLPVAIYQYNPPSYGIRALAFGMDTSGDITGYVTSYENDPVTTTDGWVSGDEPVIGEDPLIGYDYEGAIPPFDPSYIGTKWMASKPMLIESSFDRAACMSPDGRYKMFGGLWVSGPYSSTASMSIDGAAAVMLPLGLNSGSELVASQTSLSSAVQKCATNGQVWVGLISGGWAAICRNI